MCDDNHTSDTIGVADSSWFKVPHDASLGLRKLVIGLELDRDQKLTIAVHLPPLSDESPTASFEARLEKRVDQQIRELSKIPRHFVLYERMWPQFPVMHSILSNF